MGLKINYNDQMFNRYPEIIKSIKEFQTLITVQSLEVEEMHEHLTKILSNNYINTADVSKIEKWEDYLGIVPLPQGEDDYDTWINDRKATILARLYATEKLSERSISDLVRIFTGGTAKCYFSNGMIHVIMSPPPGNKQFKFKNVEQEIRNKVPAHLQFEVRRDYFSWLELKSSYNTWWDLNENFETWKAVLHQVNVSATSNEVI
jgi:hypothetical protein